MVESVEGLEKLRYAEGQIRESYDLVYVCIADPDLFWENRNAFLADRKSVYVRPLDGGYSPSDSVHIYRESHPNEALYRLAIRSGTYSRFKMDPSFPRGKFEALYRKWIEKSVEDKDCIVLCYYESGTIAGMLTLVIDESSTSAQIGLTSVDSDYSGRGIGSSLIETACWYLCGKGIVRLETVTQQHNVAACKWYEKNGFHLESVSNIYHWWLNCPKDEDSF